MQVVFHFSKYYQSNRLHPLVSLPTSQASVERVFSSADWSAENRERLGFPKLAREVFIRFNTDALA